MKIPYFCCIGAELKRYMKDFDFMNQVYLYKVPTDDSIDEVLTQDYFKAISDSVLQDDIVYIYEASENILHECRFDKQDGHITAVPLASDETLTGAVTTIIHDNLTPGKVVISDENGKIAVSDTDADELDVLHGLEATTEELNYSHGVTQNIQDQLDSTVHKAGAETITGDKTFTKPISFSMSLTDPVDVISITDTDLHSSITLSCDYASSGVFTDFIVHNYASNYDADLRIFNNDMGAFYLELTGSGNADNLSLSDADTSTTSTVIPTKGWANNPGLNNIVHKTGNESISGNKTFAGTITFNGATALSTGTITTTPTNNNDITNKNYVDTKVNTAAVPVGAIVSFAAVPAGWLACDGSAVSRTDYADLFAAIGTTFGPGDGISTFNLPGLDNLFNNMIPSSVYDDLTLGASGSTYTAPADGYFTLAKWASSGQIVVIESLSNGCRSFACTNVSEYPSATLPVKKGDSIAIYYTASGNVLYFRFVYAEETQNLVSCIRY